MSKESLRIQEAKDAIWDEYIRAIGIHGPFVSAHEGLAVIEEEFLELRENVFWNRKSRDPDAWLDAMEHEAVQLAAMALRFLVDVRKTVGEAS